VCHKHTNTNIPTQTYKHKRTNTRRHFELERVLASSCELQRVTAISSEFERVRASLSESVRFSPSTPCYLSQGKISFFYFETYKVPTSNLGGIHILLLKPCHAKNHLPLVYHRRPSNGFNDGFEIGKITME